MSLRVWLPLTKDLRNQGLDDVTVTTANTNVFQNEGKISGKSLDVSGHYAFRVPSLVKKRVFSCSFWYKPIADSSLSDNWRRIIVFDTYTSDGSTIGALFRFESSYGYQSSSTNYCISIHNNAGNPITSISPSALGEIDGWNKWQHITITADGTTVRCYRNGVQISTGTMDNGGMLQGTVHIGYSGNRPIGRLNDFRLYDHCLSPMEVKELSKGLVLHYSLNRGGWGQENLFIDSTYEQADSSIANSSTDWSKHFRRYNGSAGIHSFSDYTDTVTLSTTGNLGVTFQRKATDINLDSTSYYTISCEAKSTQTARPLCIGLSYYNNSNSWVWRGGSNPTYFEEVNKWQKFTLTFKPDADTQYIDYCFTVTGVASGTDTFSIRHCKLEKGSIATPWCPNSSDILADEMGLDGATEYDCSGYCNNSTYNSKPVVTSDTPKYSVSTHFGAYNTPKTDINDTSILSSLTNCSIAWWAKTELVKTLFFTGQDGSHYVMASNNNNFYHQNAGSPTIYRDGAAGVYKNEVGVWHHYVMTGVNLSSWTQFRINSYNSSWPLNGLISDVRIYATALSADDVKSLYQNSAYIDSDGNVYGAVHSEV